MDMIPSSDVSGMPIYKSQSGITPPELSLAGIQFINMSNRCISNKRLFLSYATEIHDQEVCL